MWQTIFTACLIISLIRGLPAIFANIGNIKNHTKLNKFLDYTICLVTGEVIYSIAFNKIPEGDDFLMHYALTAATILLASVLMWHTGKLSKTLLLSVTFFILGYGVLLAR
jgi:hypothetical protein